MQRLSGKRSNELLLPHADKAQWTRPNAKWLIGFILVLLFVINLATADRWPLVSEDEARYADPGVTLALNGHFASAAWYGQTANKFWAGQPPGYSLLVAGWVSLFGFDVTSVRTLNYVIITLVALGLVFLFRRLSGNDNSVLDVCLLLAFAGSAGVSLSFRSVRPETFGMLVSLAIVLAALLAPTRYRLVVIAIAAGFAPFTGLQTAAYVAVACFVWVVLMRRKLSEVAAVVIGMGSGLAVLFAFYAATDSLNAFVEYALEHASDSAASLKDLYFEDRSLIPILAAAAFLWFATKDRIAADRICLARFLLVLSIATPLSLWIIGKYSGFYAWMAYTPALLGVMLLMRDVSRKTLGQTHRTAVIAAAACLVIAAAIFPARMAVTVLEWQGRSYKAVEDFVASNLNSNDIAFADFAAYYPVRKIAHNAYFGNYIRLMSPEEKAALTVLIVNRRSAENNALIGGKWVEVTSFRPSLDSMPRHFGFGEQGYDLVVMRRLEDARNGKSEMKAEYR